MREFNEALRRGHQAERAWVSAIQTAGRCALDGRKRVGQSTSPCDDPDAVGLISIEIKERSLSFGPDPKSFPYPTIYVDDVRGMEASRCKPLIYVFRSAATGAWLWLSALDRDGSWTVENVCDRTRLTHTPTLTAPRSALRPASELINYLYPQHMLDLIDGEFTDGGTAKTGGGAGAADRRATPETDSRMGDR